MKDIFLDIDGTIVDHSRHLIPTSTLKAIKELSLSGHRLWLCTGRSIKGVELDLGIKINNYITSLGATITINNEVIYDRPYTKEEKEFIERLVKENSGLGVIYECKLKSFASKEFVDSVKKRLTKSDTKDVYWVEMREYSGQDIYKMMIQGDNNKEAFIKVRDILNDKYEICNSANKERLVFELSPKGISKGDAIKVLIDKGIVNKEDTIAIGDSPNDISMLRVAEVGIAMGQAFDEVKESANYITDDVSNDGFYKAFKDIGLI